MEGIITCPICGKDDWVKEISHINISGEVHWRFACRSCNHWIVEGDEAWELMMKETDIV